jgi:hypothetical protein
MRFFQSLPKDFDGVSKYELGIQHYVKPDKVEIQRKITDIVLNKETHLM